MDKESRNGSDFGAFLEANLRNLKTSFQVGDKVEGVVTQIGRNTIFVDLHARSDGVLDRDEMLDENGELTIAVGDRVQAFCTGWSDDCVQLTTRMAGRVADASLEDAFQAGIPVEGQVTEERKGGYAVTVMGQDAFCPYSQMDLYRRENADYVGKRLTFLITEYGEDGRNIVLSRRRLLEREKEAMRRELEASLRPGELRDGVVTRILPFGAFVDLGGAEGLIHVSEMGWSRTTDPADALSEGQTVTVKVLDVDWEKDRISLSLRRAGEDPWETFLQNPAYDEGRRCSGTITHLAPFGAFVEILPGIEGLIHISRLGAGRRINNPGEVVEVGETVEVSILNIDPEKRRISLAMDDAAGSDLDENEGDAEESADVIRPGARIAGTVDGHRDFGVFVRLPGGRSGLLHVSQVELKGSTNPGKALYKMFPPESSIEVVVREIRGDRISLTLPTTLEKEAEHLTPQELEDKGGENLGSLEGLFDGLNIP